MKDETTLDCTEVFLQETVDIHAMGCRWTLASKYDRILFNFPREKISEPFVPFNDCDDSLLYKKSNKQKMELFGHNTSIRLYGFHFDLAKLNDLSSK